MRTLPLFLALALGAPLVAQAPAAPAAPAKIHKVEKLSDRAYAIFGQGGNIGLFVGDQEAVLVDTQFARLVPGLFEAIASVTDKPIRFLVNTHHHGDHVGGNALVASKVQAIIAHANVRRRMEAEQAKLDPAQRGGLPTLLLGEKDSAKPARLDLRLPGLEVHIVHRSAAHTDGDLILGLPGDRVMHLGDLMFLGMLPFIDAKDGAGSFKGLVDTVAWLASWIPEVAVCEAAALKFPAAWLFPTVLVRVKVPGLGLVYLNDTDQYAALGAAPHDGQLGLVVDHGRTERIAAAADRRDAEELDYAIELDAEGNADVSYSRTTRGDAFGGENRKFSEMPPEERRRYYEETVAGLSQNAEAKGDLQTDFAGYPGTERFAARVANLAVRDGDYLYLTLPRSLHNLLGLRADERANPLFWGGPRRFRIVTRLTLPPDFDQTVLQPQEFFWNAPEAAGSVWVSVAREGASSLRIIHDVDLKAAVLPATVYANLLEVNRRLSHPAAGTVLLRRAPPAQP